MQLAVIQKQPQNHYQDENVGGVPHLLAVEHDEQHEGVADDAEDCDEGEDDGHDVRDQHLEAGLSASDTSVQSALKIGSLGQ